MLACSLRVRNLAGKDRMSWHGYCVAELDFNLESYSI